MGVTVNESRNYCPSFEVDFFLSSRFFKAAYPSMFYRDGFCTLLCHGQNGTIIDYKIHGYTITAERKRFALDCNMQGIKVKRIRVKKKKAKKISQSLLAHRLAVHVDPTVLRLQ